MKLFRTLSIIIGLIITTLCTVTSTVSAAEAGKEEQLVVGVPVDRCPMFYVDSDTNEIEGIGVDLMSIAATEAGYNVVFKKIDEDTIKDALDSEAYDIVMPFGSAIISASGKNSIVSDNLIQTPFTMVTINNKELPSLNELKVGMLKSLSGAAETVKQLYPGIEIVFYDNMVDSVNALTSRKVDALLHNSYVWSYVLQKPAYSNLSVQPSSIFSMDFRAGTLDTEKGREIIGRLNEGIAKIPETRRSAIILDYSTRKLYHYNLFDYVYQYGLVVAVFVIIIIIKIRENSGLRKAEKIADEASNAKSLFLANMSHEIRTPINTIMGMGEMISRETKDNRILQYAYNIDQSAKSLLSIVDDILDFSRMEAGRLKLRNDPYHLSNLIAEVDVMIGGRADSKDLEYKVNVNREIPDELIGDETRLKQVMINLLTNGVKYTDKGNVTLTMDYEKADNESIDLKISVSDTGIGMKKVEMDKLFHAFERLDEDRNKTIEGTGLGMSIVKHILDEMDSELNVESTYGKGSVFSFIIRQKVAKWDAIGDYKDTAKKVVASQIHHRSNFVAPNAKILIVDDTEINIKVVTGLLEPTKMKIDTALSGKQALKLLDKTRYDVIFIDYRMPEMNGLELLHHIKDDLESINYYSVCIVLTANAIEGAREMYMKAGFDEYLEKPVNGRQLEEMLLRFLPKDKIIEKSADNSSNNEVSENEVSESTEDSESTSDFSKVLTDIEDKGFINIQDGIDYAGSEELFLDTLKFFRDSVDEKADEIEKLYSSENIEDYIIKVHALKSAAKMIGAYELSDMAKKMEDAGKNNDLDYIRSNNNDLLNDYRRYKAILADI